MAFSTAQTQVAAALKEVTCPETVKQMLLTSLPNAFGPDMHQYQKEIASMMRQSLDTARTAVAETQDTLAQQVREDEAALQVLQSDAARKQVSEESARALLDEKAAELAKTNAAVAAEEIICEKAVASKEVVAAERQTLEAAKAEVESVKDGSFQMLLEGGWEDDEIRDACIEAVCNYLREENADVVLLAALPKALSFPPAKRGPFDTISVEEANRVFSEKVSGLVGQLAAGQEKWEDATAEHLGAWAVFDVARDQERAASESRDSACASLQTAIEENRLAAAKVVEQELSLGGKLAESTLLEAKVQQLELALRSLAQLESGELLEKENAMEVDKENQQNVVSADMENKENVVADKDISMSVEVVSKVDAMVVEHCPVAITGLGA